MEFSFLWDILGGYLGGDVAVGVILVLVCLSPVYIILFVSLSPPPPPSEPGAPTPNLQSGVVLKVHNKRWLRRQSRRNSNTSMSGLPTPAEAMTDLHELDIDVRTHHALEALWKIDTRGSL